ncbi:GNAT family N-acetyltransferase [Yoonia sp. I 8.24]|uniref:GNAT family N-acetyltransferase n=1 Tax=Yoonia sp. I 8.24 TaxID=1537229 RepID=UPI001EE10113|nr:GNAT family N-acetyltransferase [Yoonia sp. I 8.24]
MTLKTDRLVLREPRPSDLNAMYALYSDLRAMKYWSTAPHADRSVTKALLDRMIASWEESPAYFQMTLDGTYIGNVGNYRGSEVGFILHPDHWRKGYVFEAMQAVIPYLFDITIHPGLTADADPLNAASVGLLRRLGFVETQTAKNTYCINGVWSDSVYLALPRPKNLP